MVSKFDIITPILTVMSMVVMGTFMSFDDFDLEDMNFEDFEVEEITFLEAFGIIFSAAIILGARVLLKHFLDEVGTFEFLASRRC